MATRGAIGMTYPNGIIRGIYSHWDNYIDHNGAILQEHYDRVKANHLVSLGDVSSLGANIGEKHDFDRESELARERDWCTFYGRDRSETGTEWKVFQDADDFVAHFDGCGCEYFYLMHDGVWHVNAYGRGWVRLADALAVADRQDLDSIYQQTEKVAA